MLVYMFGKNVGFINVEAEAHFHGKRLPGFVFIRGDAVAMLLLLNNKMVLTKQYRMAMG
jgi:ADP-sugar diphosphatase